MGRTLVLEVWTGPDAGLAFALPAGVRAVVGRMPPSDVVVPSDRTVSRRHFALFHDGRVARVEDLGSSHGTTVNGRFEDDATVLDGDLIAAGGTTFRVRLADVAPPHARRVGPAAAEPSAAPAEPSPAPETFETPAPAATIHDRVLEVLRAEPSPLYAVLDAARDPMVYLRIHECPERKQSLYEDAAPDLAFVAPYLVALPRSSPFLELLVREGWGNSWGVFLTSDRPFEEVRDRLRRLLTVELSGGRRVLFRFYDPRVLRVFLPTCDAKQAAEFFEGVGSYVCERRSDRLLRLGSGPDGVEGRESRLESGGEDRP